MDNHTIVVMQTFLIAGQVGVAIWQAFIYQGQKKIYTEQANVMTRQADLMKETKDLSATIAAQDQAYKVLASRPAMELIASHTPSQGGQPAIFQVDAFSIGNGPARVLTIEAAVDSIPYPFRTVGDAENLARALIPGANIKVVGGFYFDGPTWVGVNGSATLLKVLIDRDMPADELQGLGRKVGFKIKYGALFPDWVPDEAVIGSLQSRSS